MKAEILALVLFSPWLVVGALSVIALIISMILVCHDFYKQWGRSND